MTYLNDCKPQIRKMVAHYVLVKRLMAMTTSGLIQKALKGGQNQEALVQGWLEYQQATVQKVEWLVVECMTKIKPFVDSWSVTLPDEQGQVFLGMFEIGLRSGNELLNSHRNLLQNLEKALQTVSCAFMCQV